MKLAEALQLRSDLNKEIEQLRVRLVNNALVQEGESTNEDPNELLRQLNKSINSLEGLIVRINMTNCQTIVDGSSLTELIAKRDMLNVKINSLRDLVNAASSNTRRATRTEIKILSSVDVKELQKQIDKLSKQLRLIDNTIQQANWSNDLV